MSKKAKVAVIEDDRVLVDIYRLILTDAGYTTKTATDGKSGLSLIEKFNPDIVLLDLMMPVMDGLEMLEQLREQVWGKQTKVIVLTNVGKSEVPAELKRLKVSKVAVKVDLAPNQLTDLVEEVIKA